MSRGGVLILSEHGVHFFSFAFTFSMHPDKDVDVAEWFGCGDLENPSSSPGMAGNFSRCSRVTDEDPRATVKLRLH